MADKPTAAAMRAAEAMLKNLGLAGFVYGAHEIAYFAAIIDAATGLPELIAALERIIDMLAGDQHDEETIDDAFSVLGLGAALNRARAALARAEAPRG